MFYISISILIIYLIFIFIKYKQIPESISDTFYLGANWLFTFVMWVIGFTLAAALIPITNELYQFIAFFIVGGIFLVGTSPHFKEELEKEVHYGGAILFVIASNIWSALFYSPIVLLTWLLFIPLVFTNQRIFWAEIICILNLVLAYLI